MNVCAEHWRPGWHFSRERLQLPGSGGQLVKERVVNSEFRIHHVLPPAQVVMAMWTGWKEDLEVLQSTGKW